MSAGAKFRDELIQTANAISAPGKGILAADESTGTIGKRFEKIKLENNETNRRAYRELLFTAPGDWGKYISGVILYEETLYQKTEAGVPFVEVLRQKNVIPGIKVDKGLANIPGTDGEQSTLGLDGLGGRCQEYYKAGARFAKWRAVVKVDDHHLPSELGIQEAATGLAQYAAICQENGLCPIVEAEVLMDGTHSLKSCLRATERTYAAVVKALHDHNILFEGMLLKPNMVTPGHESEQYKTTKPSEIAAATVAVLSRTIPPAVPGIMFLSGGQDEEEATLNLNAINNVPIRRPWSLSFSYGRALQASVLKAWQGKKENVGKAQEAYIARAKANSEAQQGKYAGGTAGASGLFEAGYKY
jgi:fructose-bisphosphate aldolase class I